MSKLSDPAFLHSQYKNASNLNARIALHARFSTNKYGWFRWLFDHLDLPADCRILEIGAGTGLLWQETMDRLPPGWQITLSDVSPGMLEKARENLGRCGRSFEFKALDAQAIPLKDETFDAVIANHMLYHVPDRPKALSEMRRVLRPGGCFFASTNGEAHLRELDALAERFDPGGGPWTGKDMLGFSLENGAAQLAPWFSDVKLYRYEDSLVVTEAEPFIAYVLSMSTPQSALAGENLAAFVEYVEQEIAAHGAIHISKDSGLFLATRYLNDHLAKSNARRTAGIAYRINPAVTSDDLNALFAASWPDHTERNFLPVMDRSLAYICAYQGQQLIGFVNLAWDGGVHAFLLDPTVHPDFRRCGIGTQLVQQAVVVAREHGLEWLHVDFEPHLLGFYRQCGFWHTEAGLINLKEDLS